MGILNIIKGGKDKFKNKSTKEEVEHYRQKLVAGDIEVYDNKKKTIGEMISSAKQKFRSTKAKVEMMQEEHREHQNKKLRSDYENLRLKNKVAKEKSKQIELKNKKATKGLRAIFGGVNIPTAQTNQGIRMGGEPFPNSGSGERKNVVTEKEEGRNALGGKDPFG
jgi:hypothetical protein